MFAYSGKTVSRHDRIKAIKQVTIWSGAWIEGIEVVYETKLGKTATSTHGGVGGTGTVIDLDGKRTCTVLEALMVDGLLHRMPQTTRSSKPSASATAAHFPSATPFASILHATMKKASSRAEPYRTSRARHSAMNTSLVRIAGSGAAGGEAQSSHSPVSAEATSKNSLAGSGTRQLGRIVWSDPRQPHPPQAPLHRWAAILRDYVAPQSSAHRRSWQAVTLSDSRSIDARLPLPMRTL